MTSDVERELLAICKNLVSHPYGQICVHDVTLSLLEVIDEHSETDIPEPLVKSVVEASAGNRDSIEHLERLLSEQDIEEQTDLETLIEDLVWQLTFEKDESFDWDHFIETAKRAKNRSEQGLGERV